jgi:MarR family 2-MHQ and catechol resistance regulon transcriptional repressor
VAEIRGLESGDCGQLESFFPLEHLDIKIFMMRMVKSGSDRSGVHLWLVLWKAFRAMEAEANRSIAGLGLCRSDFGVLEALLHKGPLPVQALGEKVLLTSGSMTAAIDRLVRRGWVARETDAEDRRVRLVRLTPEGRKTIQALFRRHERDMERAAAGLSGTDREEFIGLLRRLGKARIHKEKE